jgi:hypothetical protein
MISVLKENSAATFVESIPFVQNDGTDTGIKSDIVYQNKKASFMLLHTAPRKQVNYISLFLRSPN